MAQEDWGIGSYNTRGQVSMGGKQNRRKKNGGPEGKKGGVDQVMLTKRGGVQAILETEQKN